MKWTAYGIALIGLQSVSAQSIHLSVSAPINIRPTDNSYTYWETPQTALDATEHCRMALWPQFQAGVAQPLTKRLFCTVNLGVCGIETATQVHEQGQLKSTNSYILPAVMLTAGAGWSASKAVALQVGVGADLFGQGVRWTSDVHWTLSEGHSLFGGIGWWQVNQYVNTTVPDGGWLSYSGHNEAFGMLTAQFGYQIELWKPNARSVPNKVTTF